MATLRPFRALRPRPAEAASVAAVPYDVVSCDEARELAAGNPLSFLRVSRPELELPADTDPHADIVYERAVENFDRLKQSVLVRDDSPGVYFYRLRMGSHEQTGLAGCFSLEEYDLDIIKRHERTRPDKEDDRTRHMLALRAQTGLVFLTYRASADVNDVARRVTSNDPLFDFEAPDHVHHTMWRVSGADAAALVAAVSRIPELYIADGHHRAASAARARKVLRQQAGERVAAQIEFDTMLAVAFPHDQVQILPYNRVVTDLGGQTPGAVLDQIRRRFRVTTGASEPRRRGEIAMYLAGQWSTLTALQPPDEPDPIRSLDVSVLQDQLLEPILGIVDVRTDKRIEFVGGARGTPPLQRQVDSGRGAIAFSLFPVSVGDLMAVSDACEIMPPKSTWFEPKLRDGLLIHEI